MGNDAIKHSINALEQMAKSGGPASLAKIATALGSAYGDPVTSKELEHIWKRSVGDDANDPLRLCFFRTLRSWDDERSAVWIKDTDHHTSDRRALILNLLEAPSAVIARANSLCPPYAKIETLTAFVDKVNWYSPSTLWNNSWYWNAYSTYLEKKIGKAAIHAVHLATTEVIVQLENPADPNAVQRKGLVIGYVQSGKTAHFTGVIAKAADAGYRLIIVLAGTWDILRDQTQRRVDKELIGQEFVKDEYKNELDFPDFLSHGGIPSEMGAYDWHRLTEKDYDYRDLKRGIDSLEFEVRTRTLPLNHPENLQNSELKARILIIKKHPKILEKVRKDFNKLLHTNLADIPTLIIDDESDQASPPVFNTPDREKSNPTNREIRKLIALFPRCQYIGYTATPFANVLLDPDNLDDLFPRDFIVPLERPVGYMGVRDFVDLELDENPSAEPLEKKEAAFVRSIDWTKDHDRLQEALDAFILTGAIKLYRANKRDKGDFTHHTMLIHNSPQNINQKASAEQVDKLLKAGGYGTGGKDVLTRLKILWTNDFLPVARIQGKGVSIPSDFKELLPFIGKCWGKVMTSNYVRLVNGTAEANPPDFNREPTWAVLVGGNKLSRGYTVEGLTITYFRRSPSAVDTLLQMGRWFGFRIGYSDLMRLYLGRLLPIEKKTNKKSKTSTLPKKHSLYEDFVESCRMEERFREEIRQYKATNGGRIKPFEVPPLIYGSGLILPTSRRRMFNAELKNRNFGGKWTETGLAPRLLPGIKNNQKVLSNFIKKFGGWKKSEWDIEVAGEDGKSSKVAVPVLTLECSIDGYVSLMKQLRWHDDSETLPSEIALLIIFLEKHRLDHGIKRWTFFSFSEKRKSEFWEKVVPIRKRSRVGDWKRFGAFSDKGHRAVVEAFCELSKRSDAKVVVCDKRFKNLTSKNSGATLLYMVRHDEKDPPVPGFASLCPDNDLPKCVAWGFKNPSEPTAVTVPISKPSIGASKSKKRTKKLRAKGRATCGQPQDGISA